MANINKKRMVKQSRGLPTKEQLLTSEMNNDKIPAQIQNGDGSQTPAALTEGEFVFSVPAIIALGEGNHDAGIAMLTKIHDELSAVGGEMVPPSGLEAVPPEQGLI